MSILKLRVTAIPPVGLDGSTVLGTNLSNQQVDENFLSLNERKLAKSGGVMTGFITLHADPSSAMNPATKQSSEAAAAAAVATHVGASAGHPATAVSVAPTGAIAATNVQAALAELDVEKLALAGGTLTGALTLAGAPTVPLHAATKAYVDSSLPVLSASGVTVTPAGNIAAVNVQTALEELDNEKQASIGYPPVNRNGDTMQGLLTLSLDYPSSAQHAIPKWFADAIARHDTQLNLVINGAFQIWQSTTSIVLNATRQRLADCWWGLRTSGGNVTVSRVAADPLVIGSSTPQTYTKKKYSMKVQRSAGDASTSLIKIAQSFETLRCSSIRDGTQGYLLFAVTKGANYSGGLLSVIVQAGTGFDGNILDTLTSPYTIDSASIDLSAHPAGLAYYYMMSLYFDTPPNEMGVRFQWAPSGTAGADDSLTFQAMQLIPNPSLPAEANDYHFYVPDELHTLRDCQRYYQKSFHLDSIPAQNFGNFNACAFGQVAGANIAQAGPFITFPTEMRTIPTNMLTYNPAAASAQFRNQTDGTNWTSCLANYVSSKGFLPYGTSPAGSAVGDPTLFHWTAADNQF